MTLFGYGVSADVISYIKMTPYWSHVGPLSNIPRALIKRGNVDIDT